MNRSLTRRAAKLEAALPPDGRNGHAHQLIHAYSFGTPAPPEGSLDAHLAALPERCHCSYPWTLSLFWDGERWDEDGPLKPPVGWRAGGARA